MKIAVFGYGSMGKRHVRTLHELGHEIYIYDPSIDFSAKNGEDISATLCADEEAALLRADAVVIAAPARDHLRLFMAAGDRPTFVEKPLSDVSIPYWVNQFATHDARVVQVGYQLRCSGPANLFRECVRGSLPNESIGRPISAQFYVGSDLQTWPGMHYADALVECSHEIDAARWILGECEIKGAMRHGETWEILLHHDSDCITSIHLSTTEARRRRVWEVQGSEGILFWQWSYIGAPSYIARYGGESWIWSGDALQANEDAYRSEIVAFIDACLGRPVPCSLADGLAVMNICEKARRFVR